MGSYIRGFQLLAMTLIGAVLFLVPTVGHSTYIIDTIVGTGVAGYSGDGGPASSAELNVPTGLAMGPDGSLYITEMYNHVVRKVDPNGIITTIAGTGIAGFSGDGGQATQAQLNRPLGVALDSSGRVYICDNYNHRIRRIGLDGVISTIVGDGVGAYLGDGGPATSAEIKYPRTMSIGPDGNLYIADTKNFRVRMVDSAGNITTVAGTGGNGLSGDGGPAALAQLNYVEGLAWDSLGNLFITSGGTVRRIDKDSSIITTVAGGGLAMPGNDGPALDVWLRTPYGLAFDANGHLFIGQISDGWLREVDLVTGIMTAAAGTGVSGYSGDGGDSKLAQLYGTWDAVVDPQGRICFSDAGNQRIRRLTVATPTPTPAPEGAVIDAAAGEIRIPNLLNKGGADLTIQMKDFTPGPAEVKAYVNGQVVDTLFTGDMLNGGAVVHWNPGSVVAPGTPFTVVVKDSQNRLIKKTFVYVE